MDPEMMFAEARLKSTSGEGDQTPNVRPSAQRSRLALSTAVLVAVSVVVLIIASMAVFMAIARFVSATASPG